MVLCCNLNLEFSPKHDAKTGRTLSVLQFFNPRRNTRYTAPWMDCKEFLSCSALLTGFHPNTVIFCVGLRDTAYGPELCRRVLPGFGDAVLDATHGRWVSQSQKLKDSTFKCTIFYSAGPTTGLCAEQYLASLLHCSIADPNHLPSVHIFTDTEDGSIWFYAGFLRGHSPETVAQLYDPRNPLHPHRIVKRALSIRGR